MSAKGSFKELKSCIKNIISRFNFIFAIEKPFSAVLSVKQVQHGRLEGITPSKDKNTRISGW